MGAAPRSCAGMCDGARSIAYSLLTASVRPPTKLVEIPELPHAISHPVRYDSESGWSLFSYYRSAPIFTFAFFYYYDDCPPTLKLRWISVKLFYYYDHRRKEFELH